MARFTRLRSNLTAMTSVIALALAGLVVPVLVATPATADVTLMQPRPENMPTAESLPTAQMNGVAWTQLIVGNTVYVGGAFTSARPAGSPLGSNESPRGNILAYDLTTGALLPFAPMMNQQVRALAASPDGSRLYVGGSFTAVDGVARYRLAAFDTATGALVNTWTAGVDYTVGAIAATADTVYVAGSFSSANGNPRNRLAAFSASTGALLDWAPTADNTVSAMIMAPGNTKVIVGGNFTTVNSTTNQPGVVALDPVTGALVPFAVNTVVKNGGTTSGITTLSTDGVSVYGGGYTYGPGNLEGMFKADPNTGAIQWMEDCHGDTYGIFASPAAVYQVGHAHYCGNVGGFPQPASWDFRRATAFTKDATGTLIHEPLGYTNWVNYPSPSLVSWYPRLDAGTYTGKDQAAWTVTGNDQYVVLGGEFPLVNGQAQQGLARFAVRPIANSIGPQFSGALFKPTVTSPAPGQVRLTFPANWDRDDRTLTYNIMRNGQNNAPIFTTQVSSADYDRPAIGFLDTSANAAPATTSYRLQVVDSSGKITWGDGVNIVADGGAASNHALSSYGQLVKDQGASLYWPLNESTGTKAIDRVGFNDANIDTGVTLGSAGAVSGDSAMTFSGAAGGDLASSGTMTAPNTFTIQSWIKTSTTRGGRIMGFSDLQVGNSGHRDRQIYMNNSGRLSFGVWGAPQQTAAVVTSAAAYNDNTWHQVVASLGPNGMTLFVDGIKVGYRADITAGETYPGYWRVGGDATSGWGQKGTSDYFAGSIDEVSVYPTILTPQQVNAQYAASGRPSKVPADAYGSAVFYDDPTLYWRLGESTGTTAADSASGLNTGLYSGTSTKGVVGAITGTTDTAVTFNGTNSYVSSNSTFANPTVYSVEAWFKTTSNSAQKIIGFGSSKTGGSTNYDRHVYLQSGGKLVFGAGGSGNAITTPTSYNDGNWHYVVGTQGADGQKLYVDGQLAGSNGNTSASNYTGYWRVGADRVWNNGTSVAFFNGTIDEPAVYAKVLNAEAVKAHFTAGGGQLPNVPPAASFIHAEAKTAVTVDASGSSDSDGTIATYAWDFGDGATGSGVTATHTYAAAGSYPVKLTVTDNRGGTATVTTPVTVVANVAPTAAFTTSQDLLTTSLDASGSADADGTVASYLWDFGDGSTGAGVTATHAYAVGGTYTVTLTVTDNDGATASAAHAVTPVEPPNQAPTASFVTTVNHLALTADGSASVDPDGTIASYAWNFGDGQTAMGAHPSHVYEAAGTYTVTLTVTDDDGATNATSRTVTVADNSGPTAAFTSSSNGTVLMVNGTGSSDADGSVASYQWDFGDGQTGSGVTATHTYATLATYTVTLTVTDNDGATGSTSSQVALAPAVYVTDNFARTTANGWGSADLGGAWAVGSGASAASVSGGAGKMSLTAGGTRIHSLPAIGAADQDLKVTFSLDKKPAGGSTMVSAVVRKTSTSEYRVTATINTAGAVVLGLNRVSNGVTTAVRSPITVAGLTYAAGDQWTIRLRTITNAAGGVDLSAKLWNGAGAEPSAWIMTATDAAATALTSAGGVGVVGYVSGAATNAPVIVSFKTLTVGAPTA